MFLTGQLFPRPWDEPEEEGEIKKKDANYYNSSGTIQNSWNNPHLASK